MKIPCQPKIMKIYNKKRIKSLIAKSNTQEGNSIEKTTLQASVSNQPIDQASPQIYTERKQGVLPETDIRTDRFDIAIEKMDFASRMNTAKREAKFASNAKEQAEPQPQPKTE